MRNKLVALVTGTNKGIGLQIATDLAAHGFTVLVGSRNLESGETAAKSRSGCTRRPDRCHESSLHRRSGRANPERVRPSGRAREQRGSLTSGKAGQAARGGCEWGRLSIASLDEVRAVFETNVFGVIAVTQAMLPLLREAPAARIVNVSSYVGSLTLTSDPNNPHRSMFGAYSSSETAPSAVTVAFALDLESTRIKVNAACPGFTATDLTNFQGTRTVQQAAREAVRLALFDTNGPMGTFSNVQQRESLN